jgi:hypothetical protein
MTYDVRSLIIKLNITGTNSDNQKNPLTFPITMDFESKDSKEIVKNSSCEMSMGHHSLCHQSLMKIHLNQLVKICLLKKNRNDCSCIA